MEYLVQLVILALVWRTTRRNYFSGLAMAGFFLAWLPHGFRVEIPGPFPELTIHRTILLVMLGCGLSNRVFTKRLSEMPFSGVIAFTLIAQLLSCVFALDTGLSVKRLAAIVFENFLFFAILTLTPLSRPDAIRVLLWTTAGLSLAACIAALQYYNIFDPIRAILPSHPLGNRGGVAGCYQHRIHQGYAMAMGIPIALALTSFLRGRQRIATLGSVLLLAAGAYFGGSRGPWVTAGLAIIMVTVLGPTSLKKGALALLAVGVVVCIIRPGVREVLVNRVTSLIVQKDGTQNASAEYRKILWNVAKTEIAKSPTALLFGYGGMSTTLLDISDYFDRRRGGQIMAQGFSSWDSEWAAHLVQYGWVGLSAEILLRGSMTLALFLGLRKAESPEIRGILTALLAAATVYHAAMMGVAMFSPQLKYVFCSFVACAVAIIGPAKD